MQSIRVLTTLLITTTACSASVTAGGPDGSSHGVSFVASVQSHSSVGDTVTIRISNVGTQTEFFGRCGAGPLLLVQQFIGNVWTGGVQNFACVTPAAPGPVQLAPGETVSLVRVMDVAGRFRFLTPVGEMDDLSDATQIASTAFDIP